MIHTYSMRLIGMSSFVVSLVIFQSGVAIGGQSERLENPIRETIEKGELVVGVDEFVRVPRTVDSSEGGQTNPAYARIQYLVSVGDGSGRLAINDLRGPLYLTDEGGLKGSVFGVEYLGSRKNITVKTNVGEIKVKTDISTNVKLNENVQIKPSNDNIIIFDGETDKSLNSEFMR